MGKGYVYEYYNHLLVWVKNGKERVIHYMFSPNNMPIPFPLDVSVIGCYICFKEIKMNYI